MGGTGVERVVQLGSVSAGLVFEPEMSVMPLSPTDRVRHPERRARTARADHCHDRRVGRECRAGRLPAFRGAQLVLRGEVHRVVEQRAVGLVEVAVQMVDREFDRVHLVPPSD